MISFPTIDVVFHYFCNLIFISFCNKLPYIISIILWLASLDVPKIEQSCNTRLSYSKVIQLTPLHSLVPLLFSSFMSFVVLHLFLQKISFPLVKGLNSILVYFVQKMQEIRMHALLFVDLQSNSRWKNSNFHPKPMQTSLKDAQWSSCWT
jgi:hypothetical protein